MWSCQKVTQNRTIPHLIFNVVVLFWYDGILTPVFRQEQRNKIQPWPALSQPPYPLATQKMVSIRLPRYFSHSKLNIWFVFLQKTVLTEIQFTNRYQNWKEQDPKPQEVSKEQKNSSSKPSTKYHLLYSKESHLHKLHKADYDGWGSSLFSCA